MRWTPRSVHSNLFLLSRGLETLGSGPRVSLVPRALECPQDPLPSPLWAVHLETLGNGRGSGWGHRHCPAPPVGSVSEVSVGRTPRAPSGQAGPRLTHRSVRTGCQGATTHPVRAGGWGSEPRRKPLCLPPARLTCVTAQRHFQRGPILGCRRGYLCASDNFSCHCFSLVTRDFIGFQAVPEARSGPELGKHTLASGWHFSLWLSHGGNKLNWLFRFR